ncbi:sodium:calcium antiporter [Sphingomonas sp. AP4-R1]|uniref:sodium:calcium antiporter n=1 Tax=Sphingomonas sp. AP4-R1 TaxID=2735134 RepID=UPI0014938210|nr:sodium:calcium antiporter [Sphingomonas sp. AP4-R1]QJU58961.1 sodium:calcium antiporter [Sphingomonas sp. AP4-R1]
MPSLILPLVLLIGSAVIIYLSCEFFVNGVEWVGRKLAVGTQATGTVLAAFGTALPESVVTLVAVAFGASAASKELGIGAALGGPLALSTIAYATVGVVLLATRQRFPHTAEVRADFKGLRDDQAWFLVLFALKVALGLVLFSFKAWTGLLFLAAYGVYVLREMRGESSIAEEEEMEPLRLQPKAAEPRTSLALLQTGLALVVIFLASRTFVAQLGVIGPALGLHPQLVALLLSPIATELPETMNAIIWVRQGKYRLALANISGAMMIQATIPTAFGLFFTPWLLGHELLISAGVTAAAILTMLVTFSRGVISRRLLAAMGLFYVAFVGILVAVTFA